MTTKKPLVTRSDDLAWGASVFAGTRVPVDTLFEYIEAGETLGIPQPVPVRDPSAGPRRP